MRQLLTEGVLIGLAAGAITLIVSPLLCDFIWREIQSRIVFRFSDLYVFSFRFSPDGWVLAWTDGDFHRGGHCSSVWWEHFTAPAANSRDALQGHVAQWTTNRGKLRLSARDAAHRGTSCVQCSPVWSTPDWWLEAWLRGQKVFPGFDTEQVIDIEFADLENAGIDKAHMATLREQLAFADFPHFQR